MGKGKGEIMKHIGKIAALAMTLSLAFVLTACGGGASSSAASSAASSASASSASASAASASASSASASAASASAASASASSAAASASSASAQNLDAEINEYTNDFFGIEYDLPEGWTFSTIEQIANMNVAIQEGGSDMKIELIAEDAAQQAMVIVTTHPAGGSTAGLDAAAFLDKHATEMVQSFKGENVSYEATDATVTFNGLTRELPAKVFNGTTNGAPFCMVVAVAEKEGNFMGITAFSISEEAAMNAIKSFSAISAQ